MWLRCTSSAVIVVSVDMSNSTSNMPVSVPIGAGAAPVPTPPAPSNLHNLLQPVPTTPPQEAPPLQHGMKTINFYSFQEVVAMEAAWYIHRIFPYVQLITCQRRWRTFHRRSRQVGRSSLSHGGFFVNFRRRICSTRGQRVSSLSPLVVHKTGDSHFLVENMPPRMTSAQLSPASNNGMTVRCLSVIKERIWLGRFLANASSSDTHRGHPSFFIPSE